MGIRDEKIQNTVNYIINYDFVIEYGCMFEKKGSGKGY